MRKKVIASIGNGDFVMEIPMDEYRRGEFRLPLAKNITGSWSENMEASSETETKQLVFRRYGDDIFSLVGWE